MSADNSFATRRVSSVFGGGPKWLLLALGLAITLLLLAFWGVEWPTLLLNLQSARLNFLIWASFLFSCAAWARSWRWRMLLSVKVPTKRGTAFWAMEVGYLGNNFLPLRAGEILRSMVIARSTGASTSYVLATVLIERLTDSVLLFLLLPFLLARVAPLPEGFAHKLPWIGAFAVAGILVVPFLLRFSKNAGDLIRKLPVGTREMRERIVGLASNFGLGLAALYKGPRFVWVCGLTIGAWLLDAWAATVVAAALQLTLTFLQALTLLALLGLSSALPSTPGYIGIYQFVAVTVLSPFGFSRSQALAYILIFQGVTYLVVGVWGSIGLWKLRDYVGARELRLVLDRAWGLIRKREGNRV